RRSVRGFLDEMRADNPHVFENLLSAMGRIDTSRLLDKRFLDNAAAIPEPEPELLPILMEETV
ncbi:MAG: PP-loop domain-containing protein, partial [Acidobacteria bacterium]|nr:PP-loop domain-containing protein [Acidobacteriota bacterium]